MEIYIIQDIQDGTQKPVKVFYKLKDTKNYLIKEGYTERKKISLSFFFNPDNDLSEKEQEEEYDMVIYKKNIN